MELYPHGVQAPRSSNELAAGAGPSAPRSAGVAVISVVIYLTLAAIVLVIIAILVADAQPHPVNMTRMVP